MINCKTGECFIAAIFIGLARLFRADKIYRRNRMLYIFMLEQYRLQFALIVL